MSPSLFRNTVGDSENGGVPEEFLSELESAMTLSVLLFSVV